MTVSGLGSTRPRRRNTLFQESTPVSGQTVRRKNQPEGQVMSGIKDWGGNDGGFTLKQVASIPKNSVIPSVAAVQPWLIYYECAAV